MGIFEPLVILDAPYAVFAIMFPILRPGRLIAGMGRLILASVISVLTVGFGFTCAVAL
jgi:hypothetical protein